MQSIGGSFDPEVLSLARRHHHRDTVVRVRKYCAFLASHPTAAAAG